jgi:hypothetical protein
MTRQVLPQRRFSETFQLRFWNQPFTVTVGRHPAGAIGEVFINAGKSGEQVEAVARDAAVLLSLALQHGVPLSTIQHAVTRNVNGEPQGVIGAVVDVLAKDKGGDAEPQPVPAQPRPTGGNSTMEAVSA